MEMQFTVTVNTVTWWTPQEQHVLHTHFIRL
uniref:Uncharacterized protein n=1 Tax=Anguilla anguilla TaxID=7936 RepID=A0A0E9U774_ANGAN